MKLKNFRLFSCVLVALMSFVLAAGCQEKKIGVEGSVTRKGEPLAAGTITFTPDATKGTLQGANAIAKIENGKFTLPEKFGISGGWYKVIIAGQGTITGEGDGQKETQPFKEYTTSFEFKSGDATPVTIDIPH